VSQWNPNIVWTEREVGDWEACVATSYAMGLLYGGVTMRAPYTQAQRELLEVTADAPQDLNTTDARARQLFSRTLLLPSVTTSETAFLARPGMGFCLTGVGSPVGAQAGTFTHEVFGVAMSTSVIRVYDPLLPPGAAPIDRSVAHMTAWMNGIASHQVREIRKDYFVADRTVTATPFIGADGKPYQKQISFKAGVKVTGYNLLGEPEAFTAGTGGSAAPADAECVIVAANAPFATLPSGWLRITAGVFLDHPYIHETSAGIVVPADPAIGGGFTQAQLDAAVAANETKWENWNTAAQASKP
jgi:hypothetical protein